MQTLTPALLAMLLIGAPASAQTPLATALAEQLGQIPANTGFYLKHLKTGEEVAVRADDVLQQPERDQGPIMVRAFQLAEQGKLDLDERVTSDARRSARRLRRVPVRRSRPRARPCAI